MNKEAVCREFRHSAADGKSYDVQHYNLDAIIAVGYRAGGPKATEFRKWATTVLKSYMTKGYALNQTALRGDPAAVETLHQTVKRLRIEERDDHKYIMSLIRAVAVDFDGRSPEYTSNAARFQDAMHYAVTGQTAAGIKMERADGTKRDLGMTVTRGWFPRRSDAQIAKNYLTASELVDLSAISDMFGDWVGRRVRDGLTNTMAELFAKFDLLVQASDFQVFPGYPDRLAGTRADKHVDQQLAVREKDSVAIDQEWWDAVAEG